MTRETADQNVFAMDMAGLRALANRCLAGRAEMPDHSVEYDIDIYLAPWPHDYAADLLAAWAVSA